VIVTLLLRILYISNAVARNYYILLGLFDFLLSANFCSCAMETLFVLPESAAFFLRIHSTVLSRSFSIAVKEATSAGVAARETPAAELMPFNDVSVAVFHALKVASDDILSTISGVHGSVPEPDITKDT
jgi:hypothetical protein